MIWNFLIVLVFLFYKLINFICFSLFFESIICFSLFFENIICLLFSDIKGII